jgi:DNA repair protein RadC
MTAHQKPTIEKTKMNTYEIKISRVREVPYSDQLNDPTAVMNYWKTIIESAAWFDPEKEQLVTIMLDTKHRPISYALISLGTLNESLAHPREIFRPAIASAAYGFVLMHNHPSGDTTPSDADRRITKKITEGANILDMRFLDHIIISTGPTMPAMSPYFSFREMGLI